MLSSRNMILRGVSRSFSQMYRNAATNRVTSHPTFSCPYLGSIPTQQDDVCKDFYMKIVNENIESAYRKYGPSICKEDAGISEVSPGKSVLIIGAGVSGLAAAFELEKVGYDTHIVELQHRVGGRTKTLRDGFSTDLHAEGGAMRIPQNHFLTNGYIQKFGIPVRPFVNYNEMGWLYLVGENKIRLKDWKANNQFYSTKFFPGWDANLLPEIRPSVKGILDLYDKTVQVVKDDLYKLIKEKGDQSGWAAWVEKWSKLSVNEFLRKENSGDEFSLYRPWPEAAIRGFQLSTYSPQFDISLVEHLRDEIGEWWSDMLHTPVDGMDTIANNFIKPQCGGVNKCINLANKITFGTEVRSVLKSEENKVIVSGRNVKTGKEKTFTADSAIVTVPLTILRQMDIDLGRNYKMAISNINYGASTKIVLQCKSRFWEKQVGQGGFSKTDLPIGQLHYPSPCNPRPPNGRGLLVCYTWGQDALMFGAQSKDEAIASAVREITKIHPEVTDEFEVGMVQSWFSDDTTQGAYAALLPYQYNDGMKTLMTPDHPIYLAGEAISYTNAWIQGALESGLNAAYHLYCHDHHK